MKPAAATFSFIVICLSTPAFSFDLLEAWQAARQYDAGLSSAQADYRAGKALGAQGRALLLPKIDLTGSYTKLHPLDQTTGSGGSYPVTSYNINLTQPLFNSVKLAQYRQDKIRQSQAATTLDSANQQLMADVAAAYFKVLETQDTLAATEIAKKAYADQLAEAKTKFDIGTATIADTNEAQAGYDGAVADEIQAQSDLELKRNDLTRLTGLSALSVRPLAAHILLEHPKPDNLNDWLALAQQNSLKIRAKIQAVAQAEQVLAEKRSGHLPTVDFNAQYNQNLINDPASTMIGQTRTRSSQFGINVSIPLFAGGGINAQVLEAAAKLDSARDQLLNTQRQVQEEVRSAWLGVTNGAASVRAQEQRLISSKSKLDSTQLGREVGIRTNLDLLKAQQDYSDVLKAVAAARYRFLNAQLQLAQSVGQLNEKTLARVNQSIQH